MHPTAPLSPDGPVVPDGDRGALLRMRTEGHEDTRKITLLK